MTSEASSPARLELSPRGLALKLLWQFKSPYIVGILTLALVDIFDVTPPLLIKAAIDGLERGDKTSFLWQLSIAYLLIGIGQAIGRYAWRRFFLGTSHLIAFELRNMLYRHIQSLPFEYFTKMKIGDLMSRLSNDIDEIRQMFGLGLLMIMDTIFYFLWIPSIMFWLSPKLSFYVLLPAPLIPIFVAVIGNRIHARSTQVQKRLSDLSERAQEAIGGIRVIKGFDREEAQEKIFDEASLALLADQLSLARLEAFFHPALELVMGLGIFLLIFKGGQQVVAGEISLGAFVAFQSYILKLVWPMAALGMAVNIIQRGMASLARSLEILSEPSEDPGTGMIEVSDIKGSIEIKGLRYAFSDSTHPVLDGVDIVVPPGTTLGIVGPVGSGKTTLLNLVMRLLNTPRGTVFIDGRDICDLPTAQVRSIFAIVPQDAFLFSETVRENIAFGMKDKNDLAKIRECARIACILPEIEALPHGFDTRLGERGVNLSGGQKQRVTLARALASDRPVLILDDTTSAVDADTEEQIRRELAQVRMGRTTLIVSHRLVSVQDAQLIVYLEQGRIIEQGTHDELLAKGGKYAQLWKKQQIIDAWSQGR